MHGLPTALLLTLTLTLAFPSTTLAKPLPGPSLAEIERRWSAGETEVCRPNSPGCYFFAWFHSLTTFCRADSTTTTNSSSSSSADNGASIHSGTTHRDATPAWPVQRDADADADAMLNDAAPFSHATDERTMLRAQRQRRDENTPLLQKMESFVKTFYRQRGIDKGVIARDARVVSDAAAEDQEEDAAPVLKPRRGMRYAFPV